MFVSMVLYPFHGSEAGKKRLSERKEDLLTSAVVTLQRIVAFGVAVHGDSHFSLEAGEIVCVLELLDLDLGDRKALLLHESAQRCLRLSYLGLIGEIESFLGPVVLADREAFNRNWLKPRSRKSRS
jgi:hypothetical protein